MTELCFFLIGVVVFMACIIWGQKKTIDRVMGQLDKAIAQNQVAVQELQTALKLAEQLHLRVYGHRFKKEE